MYNIAFIPIHQHRTSTQGLSKVGRRWQPYDYLIHRLRCRSGSCPHCSYRLRKLGDSQTSCEGIWSIITWKRSLIQYLLRAGGYLYRVYPHLSIWPTYPFPCFVNIQQWIPANLSMSPPGHIHSLQHLTMITAASQWAWTRDFVVRNACLAVRRTLDEASLYRELWSSGWWTTRTVYNANPCELKVLRGKRVIVKLIMSKYIEELTLTVLFAHKISMQALGWRKCLASRTTWPLSGVVRTPSFHRTR